MIMLDCLSGARCDPRSGQVGDSEFDCGSSAAAYTYFTSFVFLSSFLVSSITTAAAIIFIYNSISTQGLYWASMRPKPVVSWLNSFNEKICVKRTQVKPATYAAKVPIFPIANTYPHFLSQFSLQHFI